MSYGDYIQVADFASGKEVIEAARRRAQAKRQSEFEAARAKRLAAQREERRRRLAEKAERAAKDAKHERELRMLQKAQEEAQARFEAAKLIRHNIEAWKAKEKDERKKLMAELGIRYSPSMAVIIRRICMALDVSPSDVMSHRRTANVVFARQAIMYWTIRLTTMSYPQVGYRLGGRDHTTAYHGVVVYPEKRAKQGRHLRPATRGGKILPREAA